MTKHEIEEAVNQGKCRLLVSIRPDSVCLVLSGEDGSLIARGEHSLDSGDAAPDHARGGLRDGLRDAYQALFNRVEAEYSQKLCRVSSVYAPPLLRDALPLSFDEAGGAVLTEEAARLLDPLGNLRPGVPVSLRDREEADAPAVCMERERGDTPDGELPADGKAVTVEDPAPPERSPSERERLGVNLPGRASAADAEKELLPEPSSVPEELLEDGETGFPKILEHYQAALEAEWNAAAQADYLDKAGPSGTSVPETGGENPALN